VADNNNIHLLFSSKNQPEPIQLEDLKFIGVMN